MYRLDVIEIMRVEFARQELLELYEGHGKLVRRLPIQVAHKYRLAIEALLAASSPSVVACLRGWNYERLKGKRQGQHSMRLNDQWRLVLQQRHDEEGSLVVVVEITDYH